MNFNEFSWVKTKQKRKNGSLKRKEYVKQATFSIQSSPGWRWMVTSLFCVCYVKRNITKLGIFT